MTDIDELLSSTLKRVAEPGDPTGVADAIRSRLAAGDTGTPASSSGFGRRFGWLPWVGLIVVAGLLGGILGATGVFGAPDTVGVSDHEPTLVTGSVQSAVDALGCPGGATAVRLEPGQRLLLVVRSEDSDWVGVRAPLDLDRTVWLPVGLIAIDPAAAVDSLPVGGCSEPVLAEETPVPPAPPSDPAPTSGPVAEPDPGPAPAPVPQPADTTPPTIAVALFNPQPVYGTEAAAYCAVSASVTVTATDDVSLSSVSGTSNVAGGVVSLTGSSSSTFSFAFSAPYLSGPDKSVTVTFMAIDSAGNAASAARTLVLVSSANCLI